MLTFMFFGFMLTVLLFGFGFLALTFRHHYLEYQKEKAAKLAVKGSESNE